MKRFILEQSDNDFYTSHSGLALIGLCINRFSGMPQKVARQMTREQDKISHAGIVRSMLGLLGEYSPVRHPAKRRRLKTVIQELIYLAARLISTSRCLKLRFSRHCPGYEAFERVYARLAATV